ncbi:MAG: malate synthase A, partial [Kordiimonas sp.]
MRVARHAVFVLPIRSDVGRDQLFLSSYSRVLVQTCHKRGAHAMGGMAAQIPVKGDDAANAAAMAKVKADKEREAGNGHDGTWVAHPALIPIAKDIFDAAMPDANQLANAREDVSVTAADLLAVPEGEITEAGLRNNINVALLYLAAWLDGMGCVPIHNLMEDAATAEISRTQLWQWRVHAAKLADGRTVDEDLIKAVLAEEVKALEGETFIGKAKLSDASALFTCLVMDNELEEFLTRPAYELVLDYEKADAAWIFESEAYGT